MKIWYFDKDGFHDRQDEQNTRVEVTEIEKLDLFKKLSNPEKILILSQDEKTGKPIIIDETDEELVRIQYLRNIRYADCFSIINRGLLWYDNLTEAQLQELKIWYNDWLNVTDTKIVPLKPDWIK